MAENMQVRATKRIRGKILSLLKDYAPMPMEVRTISNTLIEANMIASPDIAAHIDYLAGKKYLQIIDKDDVNRILKYPIAHSAFVKITPEGTDVVDGTTPDPGVDV